MDFVIPLLEPVNIDCLWTCIYGCGDGATQVITWTYYTYYLYLYLLYGQCLTFRTMTSFFILCFSLFNGCSLLNFIFKYLTL